MLLHWVIASLGIWAVLSTWLNYRLLHCVSEGRFNLELIRDRLAEFNERHPFPPGDARAD